MTARVLIRQTHAQIGIDSTRAQIRIKSHPPKMQMTRIPTKMNIKTRQGRSRATRVDQTLHSVGNVARMMRLRAAIKSAQARVNEVAGGTEATQRFLRGGGSSGMAGSVQENKTGMTISKLEFDWEPGGVDIEWEPGSVVTSWEIQPLEVDYIPGRIRTYMQKKADIEIRVVYDADGDMRLERHMKGRGRKVDRRI